MDTEDLKKFLVVAKLNNLQVASSELNITPGALSKIVKRIECKLNTQLFDRIGRNISLNQQGEKFRQYALHLVHEAEQAVSEFTGTKHKTTIKLSGPSLLLQHFLPKLITGIDHKNFEFSLDAAWEGQAISQVTTGQAHLALVTSIALNESSHSHDFERINLGTTRFTVVASKLHPIFKQYPNGNITSEQLSQFGFACPAVSPFCGIKRGIGSDGWHDNKIPRKITYRCNDFSVLMSLVNQGIALAYVPDFVAQSLNLRTIKVLSDESICQEQIELVYKPSLAAGWLKQFAASISQ